VELLPEDVGLAGSDEEAAAGAAWQAMPALSEAAFREKQALLRQRLQGLDVQELVL
jgi:hypothetical protein